MFFSTVTHSKGDVAVDLAASLLKFCANWLLFFRGRCWKVDEYQLLSHPVRQRKYAAQEVVGISIVDPF